MKLHDQHVHSKYSVDSEQELKDYFEYASKLGCKYFVTTEHFDIFLVEFQEDWTVDYGALKNEINQLKKEYPNITPLIGIEVGYKEDHIDKLNEMINSEDFDVVNLSIHDGDNVDFYWIKYFEKYGYENLMNMYFEIMIDATKTFTNYEVLSHIDYGFKTVYLADNSYSISQYENQIKEVFKNLIQNNKALEINTKVQEAINDDNHTLYLLKLYKELGGTKLTLSSDAHSVERYCSGFDKYIEMIKNCGFDHLVYYVKRKEYIYPLK